MPQKSPKKTYRLLRIIDKMLAVNLGKTFLAVLSIAVLIIVSRKFIKVLAQAVAGNIDNETIFSLLSLHILIAVNTFLPVAIFMAILLVLGNMYKKHEMAAIASAGGGAGLIYRGVFWLAVPVALLGAGLSLFAVPWGEASIGELLQKDKKMTATAGIVAGRFSEYNHGKLVFYAETIDAIRKMHNIFVQRTSADQKLTIASAKYGEIISRSGAPFLLLEKGELVQGVPGERQFVIERFAKYAIRLQAKTSKQQTKPSTAPTAALWQSQRLPDIAELQQRLWTPFAVLFLSLLAVPLAKLSPRGGIYSNIATAFAVYFIFANLRRINHSWIISESIPFWLGYYWIYLALGLLSMALLLRLYGVKWLFSRRVIR